MLPSSTTTPLATLAPGARAARLPRAAAQPSLRLDLGTCEPARFATAYHRLGDLTIAPLAGEIARGADWLPLNCLFTQVAGDAHPHPPDRRAAARMAWSTRPSACLNRCPRHFSSCATASATWV
ncbi:MAG: hypothetical protein U0Z44_04900 [Kouleothrix sp.]